MNTLFAHLTELQDSPLRFHRAMVFEKDFGQGVGQGFSDRHGFDAQGPRRKLMAKARNWLVSSGLTAEYSWVYWRDADVETAPATILEAKPLPHPPHLFLNHGVADMEKDLMRHNKDVIVPNVWRPLPDWLGGEQPCTHVPCRPCD